MRIESDLHTSIVSIGVRDLCESAFSSLRKAAYISALTQSKSVAISSKLPKSSVGIDIGSDPSCVFVVKGVEPDASEGQDGV